MSPSPIQVYQPKGSITTPPHRRIVLVGGCFDILHYAHIRFLEEARKAGGDSAYLMIALEPDSRIMGQKKRQPFHSQKNRAYNLSALKCVDHVLLLGPLKTFDDYNQLVQDVHPQIIAVTADDPQIHHKRQQAARIGATVQVVIDRLESFSSSQIAARSTPHNSEYPPYTNTVCEGMHLARELGYPTANILLKSPPPKPGVYSCIVTLGQHTHKGMCYYDAQRSDVLEAHLFDYDQEIYGQEITVSLRKMIRAPIPFHSLEVLKQRISEDAALCRKDLQSFNP